MSTDTKLPPSDIPSHHGDTVEHSQKFKLVRVKRKRGEEQPEAIVVRAPKRQRTSEHATGISAVQELLAESTLRPPEKAREHVFRLVATSTDKRQNEALLQQLRDFKRTQFSSSRDRRQAHADMRKKARAQQIEQMRRSDPAEQKSPGTALAPASVPKKRLKRKRLEAGIDDEAAVEKLLDVIDVTFFGTKSQKVFRSFDARGVAAPTDIHKSMLQEYFSQEEDPLLVGANGSRSPSSVSLQSPVSVQITKSPGQAMRSRTCCQPPGVDDDVYDYYCMDETAIPSHSIYSGLPELVLREGALFEDSGDELPLDDDDDYDSEDSNHPDYYTNDYPDEESSAEDPQYIGQQREAYNPYVVEGSLSDNDHDVRMGAKDYG